MNKRILITGGAGFIGSHLSERLLNDGNNVICLDNFHTSNKANIEHLLENPLFKLVQHDVTIPYFIEADEIYNLACPASPIHYQNNPIKTMKTSILGSINMLELAEKLGIKILQASTSEIYGDPEIHPQPESYRGNVNPIGTRSCYDEGKRCAETIFFDFHRQYKFPIKVVRIFNTYGPRMHPRDGRVVSNFIVQALQNQEITIYGKGHQTRSFCYIDDLIDGMIKMMQSPDDFTGPLNLGNPQECTILELAEKIIDLTGSQSKLIFKPLPPDDPCRRKPSIDLAIKKLKWVPEIPLEQGLMKTIGYFRILLSRPLIPINFCVSHSSILS